MASNDLGHTSRGKWSQPGVPKRGWLCVGVDDLEEPSQVCEMCESMDIRFVHYMEHPNYPDTLGVGCVCAEHMEQDYVRPRERENRLRNAASRRKSWPRRIWKTSAQGGSYINSDGFNIVVFPRGNVWCVRIRNRQTNDERFGSKTYPTLDAAKLGAFNALIWAKDNLG
jgi:hypothetical protein